MPLAMGSPVTSAQTVLGGETRFSGVLRFKDSLRIDGQYEGTIESPGILTVERGATVNATIKVGTLVVGGVIHGDIIATHLVEFLAGGMVIGNIRSPRLIVSERTVFCGSCEMLADQGEVDIFSMPPDRYKKNLARVN